MRSSSLLVAALLAAAPVLGAQERSTDSTFHWTGVIPAGRRLYVRNLNGPIQVDRASGNRAEVTGVKWVDDSRRSSDTRRRSNSPDVRIEERQVGSAGDVIVCAIWYDNTNCDEDGYDVHGNNRRYRDDDVSVEFTVHLPEGVKLVVSSVNGALDIDGATSDVDAHTVNGRVTATSSGGPVTAGTVNGDVEVRMGTLGDRDQRFSTVNGSITLYVPDGVDADVDLTTVNGSIGSDFPLTLNGRINPRHIRATIGKGGRTLQLHTVNGSVDIRKR